MNTAFARLLRIPLTIVIVWTILVAAVPVAMANFAPYLVRPGIYCVRTSSVLVRFDQPLPANMCKGLAELYHLSFVDLFVESMFRSLALLVGAAVLALVVGTLLGLAGALLRRRAWASGGIVGITTLLSAVPAFFVAYFLQILVIIVGATPEGEKLLPVFGFGYDNHLVLPLLSVSIPAIAFTAQLTATRMQDVLDADFITTANAKGLGTRDILLFGPCPAARAARVARGTGQRSACLRRQSSDHRVPVRVARHRSARA